MAAYNGKCQRTNTWAVVFLCMHFVIPFVRQDRVMNVKAYYFRRPAVFISSDITPTEVRWCLKEIKTARQDAINGAGARIKLVVFGNFFSIQPPARKTSERLLVWQPLRPVRDRQQTQLLYITKNRKLRRTWGSHVHSSRNQTCVHTCTC